MERSPEERLAFAEERFAIWKGRYDRIVECYDTPYITQKQKEIIVSIHKRLATIAAGIIGFGV